MSAAPLLPSAAHAEALTPQRLAQVMPAALAAGEFALHYQPQVCLHSGQVVGVEALLRWQSPVLGAITPAQFIPAAEQHGLMDSLGLWVLQQACAQGVAWQRAGLPALRVAVNLSPLQLQPAQLVAAIQHTLLATGATAHQLGIEVTESAAMSQAHQAAEALQALKSMGVEIALDDFGVGQASLSCLRRLPVDVVKIDRSFIHDLVDASDCVAVTRSVISMAHALHKRALAEGVETEAQLHVLLDLGCDLIQGYWFSPPVPADELAALLRTPRPLAQVHTHRRGRDRGLLLVDDEPHILSALTRLFRRDGYRVITATSGTEGLERLACHDIDVIVSDQRMPGMTGVEFLREAKARHPDTVRMTLSGYTDLQSIIDAVNEGAVYKFLTKPWDDDLLRGHVAEAFRHQEMAHENRQLQCQVAHANRAMAQVNDQLAAALAQQVKQNDWLQHSANGWRSLMESLPLAVLGLDPEGLLVQVNEPARALLPPQELALGDPAGPRVMAIREALLTLAPGHSLYLPDLSCRAWRQILQHADGGPRGELLVLAPEPDPALLAPPAGGLAAAPARPSDSDHPDGATDPDAPPPAARRAIPAISASSVSSSSDSPNAPCRNDHASP